MRRSTLIPHPVPPRLRSRTIGVALALGLAAFGCANPTDVPDASGTGAPMADRAGPLPGTHRQYGTPVKLGNGFARSYIILNDGVPLELGVALSERALDDLPSAGTTAEYEYLLPLPEQNPTQYQLIELNWNPGGHPPPGIYTVPHFDFHFFVVSLAERNAVDPSDPNYAAKAANLPGTDYRPAGYFPPPGVPSANAVPRMGLHWINPTSPEFQGQGFTRTFIFGSWDGRFTFVEPMITRAYLLGRPDVVATVPVASKHDPAGYYPNAYRVTWDPQEKEWHVAITALQAYE